MDTSLPPATGDAPRDPVRAILEALGGQPVLLPIDVGKKGPRYDDWSRLTWEQTQDPEHPLLWTKPGEGTERTTYRTSTYGAEIDRVRREGGNLGVLLGTPSRCKWPLDEVACVLCSIDIDDEQSVAPFLELNPALAGTLRTRGRRGCNLWLWVRDDGEREKATRKLFHAAPDGRPDPKRSWGEWRAEGGQTVIWGVHPEGMRYERVSDGRSPAVCGFSEVAWPPGVVLPWEPTAAERLVDEVGIGWTFSKEGRLALNQPYFAAKYKTEHRILFEPDEAAFYQYEPARGLWVKRTDDEIQWAIACDMKKIADEEKLRALITARSSAFLRGVVQILRGMVLRRDAFRREAGLIHLRNCMLDLRGGELKLHDFSPDFFSRNQVPVDFDAEATCPLFQHTLVGPSVLSVERSDLLQRWAGSLLLGPNVMQRFVLLYGTAGGGKSTFVGLMRLMIGQENTTQLRTKHLEERFEMFFYVGKQLLIGPDVKGDFLQQPAAYMLKALVGGDPLSAERKQGGEAIQIRGEFHVAITCNERLLIKLQGDADAYRRRMLPIHYCLPKPERRIDDFQNVLFRSEASGVLNWMLAGARRVLAEKEEHGDYVLTDEQAAEIDSLLAESDSVRHFVRHGVERSTADTVTLHELAESYVDYCDGKGWRAEPFKRAMTAIVDAVGEVWRQTPRNDIPRASADGREKSQRGFKGLRLVRDSNQRETTSDASGPY